MSDNTIAFVFPGQSSQQVGMPLEQICSPVQSTRCVQAMVDGGSTRIVECGPGKVLSGLNRRIDKSLQSYFLEEPEALEETVAALGASSDHPGGSDS